MSKIIEYYVHGHTGKGFVNYLSANLQNIKKIILLKNENMIVISQLLNILIKNYKEHEVEIIKSTKSIHVIDGIIIRELSVAILNEQIYQHKRTNNNNIIAINIPNISIGSNDFQIDNEKDIYAEAYNYFKDGLSIHEELEKLYISEMDFSKADKIIDKLLLSLFTNVKEQKEKTITYERLFGTNTPDGIVNTIPSLLDGITRKIFILGRAGTGKSYVMNQVLNKCIDLCIDVEIYRCSLDPESIDMLIIRDLNVCLLDNTPPHQVNISDNNIEIIDMYKETVNPEIEVKYVEKINKLKKQYKQNMQQGLKCLLPLKLKLEKDTIKHIPDNLEKIVNQIRKSI